MWVICQIRVIKNVLSQDIDTLSIFLGKKLAIDKSLAYNNDKFVAFGLFFYLIKEIAYHKKIETSVDIGRCDE